MLTLHSVSPAVLFLWLSCIGILPRAAVGAPVAVGKSIENFSLPTWKSDEKVSLTDFTGQIVVLDFFAYWCVPCKKASAELEAGIQRYYAGRNGNPNGVPVQVLSINIEKDKPAMTDAFIRQAGLHRVLNDNQGELLAKLGGAGTPFILVLDGTTATAAKPEFRVLYRREGFEGTQKLRQVIDAIKLPKRASLRDGESDGSALATGVPVTRKLGLPFDALLASDITIASTSLSYGEQRGGTEWQLGYAWTRLALEYEPFRAFDFLGYSERIEENHHGGQVSIRQKWGERWTVLASGGLEEGFGDFRSLWLANYYKQQFSFVPGYEAPDPQGFNAAGGVRWEYQPTTGFIEARLGYGNNQIAPGYELDANTGDLVHGRDILHTYAPTLKFENVLSRRIRVLNEFELRLTTGRDPRYAYKGLLNIALGDRWVWRASGGYTHEDPTLEAWFAGNTLEYELSPHWRVNVSGIYYSDTGEIENSLFISTAAPGLRTYQAALGFRYLGEKSSFSFSIAPVRSEYQPLQTGTRPFAQLYRDRTWIQIQAAWALEF